MGSEKEIKKVLEYYIGKEKHSRKMIKMHRAKLYDYQVKIILLKYFLEGEKCLRNKLNEK